MNTTPKTALDICNLALEKLGEPRGIPSINSAGLLPQRLCCMHYHPARREVLCAKEWKFALKKVHLHSPTEKPGIIPFKLPMDCLRVRNVSEPDWEICLQTREIFCNTKHIMVKYTADTEDVEQFPEPFIEAFVVRLAWKLCIPMTNSTKMLLNLQEEYHNLIKPCR